MRVDLRRPFDTRGSRRMDVRCARRRRALGAGSRAARGTAGARKVRALRYRVRARLSRAEALRGPDGKEVGAEDESAADAEVPDPRGEREGSACVRVGPHRHPERRRARCVLLDVRRRVVPRRAVGECGTGGSAPHGGRAGGRAAPARRRQGRPHRGSEGPPPLRRGREDAHGGRDRVLGFARVPVPLGLGRFVRMKNVLTVEVEEYFHDEGFADTDDRGAWDGRASHVRSQTMRLLDLLDAKRRRATFFVLGWVADRDRSLVREIADRGHEVASHGMSHRMPDTQTPRTFRMDVRTSKKLLQDITQEPVTGYRAPGFAVNRRTPWAHEILAEEGFTYSSSVCPPRIDGGDDPGQTTPWKADAGRDGILEMPPLSHRLTGQNVPIAGGSYLRLLPMRPLAEAIAAMNDKGAPAVLTLRPWEIDDTRAGAKEVSLSRWRHWVGVELFETKLATLLREHSFGSVRDWMATTPQAAEPDAGPQRNERAAV